MEPFEGVGLSDQDRARITARANRLAALNEAYRHLHKIAAYFLAGEASREALAEACANVESQKRAVRT